MQKPPPAKGSAIATIYVRRHVMLSGNTCAVHVRRQPNYIRDLLDNRCAIAMHNH
jgi:hypothetical protein